MSETTFEASTVEAALEEASAKIGAAVSDLEYEVVEEKADFWGLGEGTVVIKAWERREQAAAPADEAGEPSEAGAGGEIVDAPREAAADEQEAEDETASVAKPDAAEATEPTAEKAALAPPPAAVSTPAEPAAEGAEERAADAAPGPAAEDEAEEEDKEDVDPRSISGMLEQIFHDMEFECTVTMEAEDGGFLATIDGADKDALLEGNGRCLSALELLVNNAFRHRLPRGAKIRVDAGDFRNRRDEELSDLAFQVAHSAKESGRTQETQPLNPYERRLVHLALAEDPAVTTRSRGSGFLKNVQVIPRGSGGDRNRGRRR